MRSLVGVSFIVLSLVSYPPDALPSPSLVRVRSCQATSAVLLSADSDLMSSRLQNCGATSAR